MKVARFFGILAGAIFGIAGVLVLIGSVALAVNSLDEPVRLSETPVAAEERSQELMEAVARGDYQGVSACLYGQPDLGVGREPEDEMGKLIWDAFVGSISYEFSGQCYATDSGISRDASITSLDIASAGTNLKSRVKAILDAQVAQAEDMTEIYDESNNIREELVMAALSQAVADALKEDTTTVTRDVTMNLIFRDGQWWVVPDQALLQAISGNMAS
ncbi:MAG: hypothetical protein Q4F17_11670 [Eubacteriales bacterium]|nr:hypothetical protein [Eubacteriales bacterium]